MQRTVFLEACPLKPCEHVVCLNKSTLAIVMVDYFLAVDDFSPHKTDLSRAGRKAKPTSKSSKVSRCSPTPQIKCMLDTYMSYLSNKAMKPTTQHNSYYLSKDFTLKNQG